jgi:hypothetical protein
MKNLNMWYNEKLDEYAKAALPAVIAADELGNQYSIARRTFDIAKVMIEIRDLEYAKKD